MLSNAEITGSLTPVFPYQNAILTPTCIVRGGLPPKMQLTFWLALVGMALLYFTLWRYEMAAKLARGRVRALRRRLAGEDVLPGRSAAPIV